MKKALSYIFGVILILGSIAHLLVPDMYEPMIPGFISPTLANILSFIAELGIGILLVLPKYRHWGGLGFMALMLAFLPIHIWDYMKDEPYIGSKGIALVRITLQLLMIYAGWWIYGKAKMAQ